MRKAVVPFAVCAFVLLAGSAGASGLSEEDLAAVEAVSGAFAAAMVAGDMDAVAAMYTEDAILCPPNQPMMQGRQRIRAFLATFPKCTEMQLENLEIRGFGDMAYATGIFTMTLEIPGTGSIQDTGKFLDVRRKGADGVWRFVADMFNTSLPLPDAASE